MGQWSDLLLTGANVDEYGYPNSMWEAIAKRRGRSEQNKASPQPPEMPQASPQPKSYSEELLGTFPAPQTNGQEEPQPPESWGQWIGNKIMGKQDPREADTGTVFEQFRSRLESPTATAALGGAEDAAMGDIIAKNLGNDLIRREKDANGYEVMVTRGPNGEEQRGYVNRPGLDTQDAWRFVYGLAPYALSGGVAGSALKGAGIGANMIGQGIAAGTTKVAGDAANIVQGSEQGVDLQGAGVMGAFGAAGPAVGAAAGSLWRRFVTVPGLFDKASGTLTARGIEAARKAGIDPEIINRDYAQSFAKAFAESGDEAQAAVKAGAEQYGIPATRGQITKDKYLLTQEEAMRRRLKGEEAQKVMAEFDKKQADAVRTAVLGQTDPSPAAMGGNIGDALKSARATAAEAEDAAWKGATGLEATDEALATLPAKLNEKLAGMMPNDRVTPAAAAMAKEVERLISGEAPEKAASWLASSPTRNVDQMRRSMLSMLDSAENGADKKMAGAIYDGFNEWISDAAGKSLLKGDPEAAMKLIKARGFTREVRQLFSPETRDGLKSPAAQRIAKILDETKADSGEAVIQALFGQRGSQAAGTGTVHALQNIKTILNRFAPEQAEQAWTDIRMAYWSRLVTDKSGRLLGPTALVSNIKAALKNQHTLMKTIFEPEQLLETRRLLSALQAIEYKPPNASGSGYTAASLIKDGVMKVIDSLGFGRAASTVVNMTGLENAWNGAAARKTIQGAVPPLRPRLPVASAAAGKTYDQNIRQSNGR